MLSSATNNRINPTNTGGGGGINSLHQSIITNRRGTVNSSRVSGVIVSPPTTEQHERVVCALFYKEVKVDDIPSHHICPLTQEPPVVGVYFDILDRNGDTTDQVFERSQLYRWIATPGDLRSRRNVSHPINQQFVPRPSAWNLVRPITANLRHFSIERDRL